MQGYHTDVLVVGSGPAGGSAALLPATYGVRTLLVSKYGWVANTPRAHIANQRTLEVLRDLGLRFEAVELSADSVRRHVDHGMAGALHSPRAGTATRGDGAHAGVPCPVRRTRQAVQTSGVCRRASRF
jgi:2-polyprenyl-6-methoxyphenol hydroxylase-like FAD-dependent oxidoreductase